MILVLVSHKRLSLSLFMSSGVMLCIFFKVVVFICPLVQSFPSLESSLKLRRTREAKNKRVCVRERKRRRFVVGGWGVINIIVL